MPNTPQSENKNNMFKYAQTQKDTDLIRHIKIAIGIYTLVAKDLEELSRAGFALTNIENTDLVIDKKGQILRLNQLDLESRRLRTYMDSDVPYGPKAPCVATASIVHTGKNPPPEIKNAQSYEQKPGLNAEQLHVYHLGAMLREFLMQNADFVKYFKVTGMNPIKQNSETDHFIALSPWGDSLRMLLNHLSENIPGDRCTIESALKQLGGISILLTDQNSPENVEINKLLLADKIKAITADLKKIEPDFDTNPPLSIPETIPEKKTYLNNLKTLQNEVIVDLQTQCRAVLKSINEFGVSKKNDPVMDQYVAGKSKEIEGAKSCGALQAIKKELEEKLTQLTQKQEIQLALADHYKKNPFSKWLCSIDPVAKKAVTSHSNLHISSLFN